MARTSTAAIQARPQSGRTKANLANNHASVWGALRMRDLVSAMSRLRCVNRAHQPAQRLFFHRRGGAGRGCGVGPLGPSPTHGRPPAAVKPPVPGGRTNFNPAI